MVDSKHQWKAWIYLLPAIILLLIFTVWPIFNTVTTAFIYKEEYKPPIIRAEIVGDEEYKFYFTDSNENNQYLSAVIGDEGDVQLEYGAAENAGVFTYDADITAWALKVGEKQYFIGATDESGANLFELTDENVSELGRTLYPATLFAGAANNYVTAGLDAETNYTMGVFKGVPEAIRYILDTADEGYLYTTDILDNSAQIAGQKCQVGDQTGYKLYLPDENVDPIAFLNVTVDENGSVSMEYAESTDVAFVYNKTNKAWVCTLGETEYYLGLDGINRMSVYPLAEMAEENAPAPVTVYLHRGGASVAESTTKFMEYMTYRIGVNRAANGTQTFITDGATASGGIMLTEDYLNGESFSKFGINNFTEVLTHEGSDFKTCLFNTILLTIITVPISTILALLIAVGLNSIKPLQRLLQTIFFLPYVTNSIAIGMVFAAMFNIVGIGSTSESVGIINNILGVFGVERINWINIGAAPWASFTALIIYIIWNALPFKILILLGGLQSINKQYYDAAKIDSTPKWRVLTRITVPLLSPMITYTVITSFIGGFKEYSSVVGIFGEAKEVAGGANMNTIVGHIQNHLTETQDYGLAGAAALMLFVIIFVVTMINLRISKKNTHY